MAGLPTGGSLQLRGAQPCPFSREALVDMVGPGPWLVAVPHDDDLVLGSGMLLALAAEVGIEVHVAVCSDGSLGYAQPQESDSIADVRRAELEAAMQTLGLEPARVHYLNFADGALALQVGARAWPKQRGLGQSLAALVREVVPGVVFSCHADDVHPDHRAVAEDTAIACFWASSEIWLELGAPVPLPAHWLYGVYVGFATAPHLRLRADPAVLARKLDALACFESQTVIESLVARVRGDGPQEFFQRAPRKAHSPATYAAFFDDEDPQ